MKDVLENELMVFLVTLQKKIDRANKEYHVDTPKMAGCGWSCQGGCFATCKGGCPGIASYRPPQR
jgi:hypothetical protein